jgi:hypothetical protein
VIGHDFAEFFMAIENSASFSKQEMLNGFPRIFVRERKMLKIISWCDEL